MKYYKTLKIYKISNCTFNPEKIEAHSYSWWKFVAKVDGVVIFNNYYYSPTTYKHQHKVKRLMHELGIKIDIEAPFCQGIGNYSLEELYNEAEQTLCDLFLKEEEKKISRSERAKARREKVKTEADAKMRAMALNREIVKMETCND